MVFKKIKFSKDKFEQGEDLAFTVELHSFSNLPVSDIDFGFTVIDNNNQALIHLSNRFLNLHLSYDPQKGESFKIKTHCNLRPGKYQLTLFLRVKDKIQDWLKGEIEVEINNGNPYSYFDSSKIKGLIFPEFSIDII